MRYKLKKLSLPFSLFIFSFLISKKIKNDTNRSESLYNTRKYDAVSTVKLFQNLLFHIFSYLNSHNSVLNFMFSRFHF
jgi:hypothetical protein